MSDQIGQLKSGPKLTSENYIKFLKIMLWILLGMGLAMLIFHPGWTAAAPGHVEENIIFYKPVCDPVLAKTQSEEDCFYRAPKPTYPTKNYADNCVEYAKHYIGVTGTWGAGGKNLELTQVPEVGSIVVFDYTHVAVIVEISNRMLTLTESNFSYKKITTGRQIPIGDPTIRGYFKPL